MGATESEVGEVRIEPRLAAFGGGDGLADQCREIWTLVEGEDVHEYYCTNNPDVDEFQKLDSQGK